MEFKRKMVAIECPNCRAQYRAVLADRAPGWDQKCLECDTPVRGQHVYYLFAPSDLS
jgi:hypothetical protein